MGMDVATGSTGASACRCALAWQRASRRKMARCAVGHGLLVDGRRQQLKSQRGRRARRRPHEEEMLLRMLGRHILTARRAHKKNGIAAGAWVAPYVASADVSWRRRLHISSRRALWLALGSSQNYFALDFSQLTSRPASHASATTPAFLAGDTFRLSFSPSGHDSFSRLGAGAASAGGGFEPSRCRIDIACL